LGPGIAGLETDGGIKWSSVRFTELARTGEHDKILAGEQQTTKQNSDRRRQEESWLENKTVEGGRPQVSTDKVRTDEAEQIFLEYEKIEFMMARSR
jgi:hypothetical protein